MLGLQQRVLFSGVEAIHIKIFQVGRLKDRHVVGAINKQVLIELLAAVLVKLFTRPLLFLGAQEGVVGVEAVDELLAVYVLLIGLGGVPIVDVAVDDENFFTACGFVHGSIPYA